MDSSFQLSPSEHERIYQKIIEPTSFDETAPVEKPRIVIVGAQTAAGKSKLIELSIKEFGDATPVTVNTDDPSGAVSKEEWLRGRCSHSCCS